MDADPALRAIQRELLGAVVGKSMRPDDYMVAYYRDGMSQMAKGFRRRSYSRRSAKSRGTRRESRAGCTPSTSNPGSS